MSKLPKEIEDRFDEEFKYFSGHEMLQTHQGHEIIKSFIATILEEATKDTWIDGFMASGEGYNGEYIGGSIAKGRTVREVVTTDIYGWENNHSKDEKHVCCDDECNHDDCCGKIEANCPIKSSCNHVMVDIGKYERECKFCKLTELRAK